MKLLFWIRSCLFSLAALGVSATSFGLPLLSDVFYDAVGSDRAHVFTEIVGTPGFGLEDWSLVGVNGGTGLVYRTIDLTGAVIPPDGVLVIATASATGALADLLDFVADVDWQNGPDAVELWTPLSVRADALQYGDTGGPPLGNGLPAPDAAAGFSLSRWDPTGDTGDNASDFLTSDPTPGVVPERPVTVDVSEPRSAELLLFLLAVPALLLRRASAHARLE